MHSLLHGLNKPANKRSPSQVVQLFRLLIKSGQLTPCVHARVRAKLEARGPHKSCFPYFFPQENINVNMMGHIIAPAPHHAFILTVYIYIFLLQSLLTPAMHGA